VADLEREHLHETIRQQERRLIDLDEKRAAAEAELDQVQRNLLTRTQELQAAERVIALREVVPEGRAALYDADAWDGAMKTLGHQKAVADAAEARAAAAERERDRAQDREARWRASAEYIRPLVVKAERERDEARAKLAEAEQRMAQEKERVGIVAQKGMCAELETLKTERERDGLRGLVDTERAISAGLQRERDEALVQRNSALGQSKVFIGDLREALAERDEARARVVAVEQLNELFRQTNAEGVNHHRNDVRALRLRADALAEAVASISTLSINKSLAYSAILERIFDEASNALAAYRASAPAVASSEKP
jgi:hypothetical protein